MTIKYDVFGIGNALMDLLIEVTDEQLTDIIAEFGLMKGEIRLFNENEIKEILTVTKDFNYITSPGGSCANTIYGVSLLGAKAAYCGKVGKDKFGELYESGMGTITALARSSKMTGLAITFISPDGERTFADHLGAAISLQEDDLDLLLLESCKILHLTGYLLEEGNLRAVATKAMDFALKKGIKVSIDLADPGVVKRNKSVMLNIIEKYADIVYANEDEAKMLTGLSEIEALASLAEKTDIAIVKVGKQGSYIRRGEELVKIASYPVKTVDTTGAGDMYASGILYGLSRNLDLKVCGHLGSYYAAKVVGQVSARLDKIDFSERDELIKMNS